MKKNKNIIILGVLILVWIVSFIFTNKTDKKIDNEKHEVKRKKIEINKEKEEDFFDLIKQRGNLTLNLKKDIFSNSKIISNNLAKEENVIKKIERNETKTLDKSQKNERIIKENYNYNNYETQSNTQNSINMDNYRMDEDQLITTELYNIEVQGVLKNKNSKIAFLYYRGTTYEIIDEGNIKIYTNNKSYDIKVYYYDDDYITFVEKTKNISIKKRIRE